MAVGQYGDHAISTSTMEFSSKENCEYAAKTIVPDIYKDPYIGRMHYACVKK